MTSPPPPPPLKQRPDYGRKSRGCGNVVFAIGALVLLGLCAIALSQIIPAMMHASGWNCAVREFGYSQGMGLDDPPETSPHCKGIKR
jgi:hypothetical protein